MSLKDTVEKIRSLEAEKANLLVEVESLKRMADARANALADEIAALKEQVASLKIFMEQEKPPPSEEEIKEKNLVALKELAGKTLNASDQLGNQVFASSPFSQYFDDWLTNLKKLVMDFETGSPLMVDDQFVNDRSQLLTDVEGALTKRKTEETEIGAIAKSLADNNHLLVEADKEYAENARELSLKRDSEVERLNNRIHELEKEVQTQDEENSKRKILKKRTDDKLPQARVDLKTAKTELETTERNFAAEQDTLHECYEKKKQEITCKVDALRSQLNRLETDSSIEVRQSASKALANSINAMIQRAS